jgi:hypothetical protein
MKQLAEVQNLLNAKTRLKEAEALEADGHFEAAANMASAAIISMSAWWGSLNEVAEAAKKAKSYHRAEFDDAAVAQYRADHIEG